MSNPQDHRELLQDDEYLHNLHNKVLEERRDFLCRNGIIQPRHHYSFLRSKGILNLEICAEIDHIAGPTARANRFIDELQRNGGSKALGHFMESLQRDRTQIFVLKKLNETLEELKRHPPPSMPSTAPFQNNGSYHPHKCRECTDSSTASEGDMPSSPLREGPTEQHLLRPGEPGAPQLPSFESLAKCMANKGQNSEHPENIHTTHNSKLQKH